MPRIGSFPLFFFFFFFGVLGILSHLCPCPNDPKSSKGSHQLCKMQCLEGDLPRGSLPVDVRTAVMPRVAMNSSADLSTNRSQKTWPWREWLPGGAAFLQADPPSQLCGGGG